MHQVLKYTLHSLLSRTLRSLVDVPLPSDVTAPSDLSSNWPGAEVWDDADLVIRQVSHEVERPEHAQALKEVRWVLKQLRASAPYAIGLSPANRSRPTLQNRLEELSLRAQEEVQIFSSSAEKAELPIVGFDD